MTAQNQTTQKFLNDARSLRQKVDDWEQKVLPSLIQNVGRELDGLKQKTDFMAEWLDAVVGIVGLEPIQAAVLEARTKKAVAEAEATKQDIASQKEAIASQKEAGTLVNVETVEDDCFVIMSEVKNDTNEPVGPGWFKLHTSQMKPEFRELLKDKPAGYSERREETTFAVLEVLKAVKVPTAPTEA